MLIKTVPSKGQLPTSQNTGTLGAHGLLVLLNEFLLLSFLLHPVITQNDKVRCDLVFWVGIYDLTLSCLALLHL